MKDFITKTINLKEGNVEEKRKEIRNYFLKTWEIDEKLYTQLKSDDIFYHRGDPLRHVLLFYLGHTAVFFINKLILAKIIHERINPNFESIFAIGVDEMSWDDLDNNHYNWATVADVREYREKAKKTILDVIDNVSFELPILWKSPMWVVMMGIEHERIHLETSSVLIRQLPLDEVVAGKFGERCMENGKAPKNELISIKGKTMKLGKPANHHFYGWDNEYGEFQENVSDFEVAKFLVSNEEYLEFIHADGYKNQSYWTEEGWNWKTFKDAELPLFWRKRGDEFWLRLVAEEIPMPWNWPVEVNYLEAKAFANWKSAVEGKTYRLPTEAEWYLMFEKSNLKDVDEWDKTPANINLDYFTSPCPVDKFDQGAGLFDVIGNVWQWTETPITGFSGFKVHPLYDDFSTPTFDGKHNLIKGGSWISTGNEATYHSRYAFRRHFYQHAGIRLVQSETPLKIQNSTYETDEEVIVSAEANWGTKQPNFYKTLAEEVVKTVGKNESLRILDLNADTGRFAFELSNYYKDITALDFTARMIRLPIQLQEQGFFRYVAKDEGELQFYKDVVLADYGLEKHKNNILFMQADAMNMKPNFTNYDVVILPNLLEEVRNPIDFLTSIHSRINENGLLIVTSSYDWKKEITPRENWIGGFKEDGEPVTSLEGLQKYLNNHFSLEQNPIDLVYDVKRSSRITESRIVQLSIWRKIK